MPVIPELRVEGLFTCPYSSRDMLSRQVIQLTAGRGVEGDRYQSGLGTYSCFSEPGRQLTLISADAVEAALPEMKGRTCDLRRNVVLRGCSAETLNRVNLRLEEAPNASRVNDGGKPDGFFVAPKHRSAEQARNARASAERGRVVQNSDPVGYERLQAAYRSVGIRSFFLADTTGPSVGQSGFALLSTLPLVLAAVVLALALAQLPWR